MTITVGTWQQASRDGAGAVSYSSDLDPQVEWKAESYVGKARLLKSKSPLLVVHLQKLTTPNSSQMVPLIGKKVFKYMSLWGPSIFRPPQVSTLSSLIHGSV